MTQLAETSTIAAWDEPEGATPRGTVVILPGRGETARAYERFGRRISADAFKVRLVPVDLGDLDGTRAALDAVLADDSLPSPRVLVGADTGATWAATVADTLPADGVDGVVLAGLVLAGTGGSDTVAGRFEDELDARSACPVHRSVLGGDAGFRRGALDDPVPSEWEGLDLSAPAVPTLVLHGDADRVTDAQSALAPFVASPTARVWAVRGGLHDVLNDVSHRSVAATIVLFLEALRLGPDGPAVLVPVTEATGVRR